ncbi:MAG TPA: proton-conducting transporter membrane subunit, partial [Anaerolineae bacterium]|nr:proton-conducting transporter membrane subunit [Anaerolineae bacterium]
VMHALHDVIDMRHMGGLKNKMKITWLTFWAGGLALAGFPLTSGFFSKDEILAKAFEASPALWLVGIITAGLTAFYTFRAIFMAFHGQPRDQHLYEHAHESRPPITFALVVLAILALLGGLLGLPTFLGLPHALDSWLEPIYAVAAHSGAEAEHHLAFGTEIGLLFTSAVVAIAGIALAYFFYLLRPSIPQNLARSLRPIYNLLANKYYIDEIYNAVFVKPALLLAEGFAVGCDKLIIDGVLVDGLAKAVAWVGQLLSYLQSGYLRHYALATFIGVLVMITYFFLR